MPDTFQFLAEILQVRTVEMVLADDVGGLFNFSAVRRVDENPGGGVEGFGGSGIVSSSRIISARSGGGSGASPGLALGELGETGAGPV